VGGARDAKYQPVSRQQRDAPVWSTEPAAGPAAATAGEEGTAAAAEAAPALVQRLRNGDGARSDYPIVARVEAAAAKARADTMVADDVCDGETTRPGINGRRAAEAALESSEPS